MFECIQEIQFSIQNNIQVRRLRGVRQTEGCIIKIIIMIFQFIHIFLNIDSFLMKFVPFESSQSQLSNGTNFIKNGSILRKLWANQVDSIYIYKERDNSVTEYVF